MAEMTVSVVAVDRSVWSGTATSVVAKTPEGEIGLLAGHETLDQRSVGRSTVVVPLPCRSDRFIFSGQDAALRPFIVEQKVGVSGDILPAVSQ